MLTFIPLDYRGIARAILETISLVHMYVEAYTRKFP
jgi:hypothetical protein